MLSAALLLLALSMSVSRVSVCSLAGTKNRCPEGDAVLSQKVHCKKECFTTELLVLPGTLLVHASFVGLDWNLFIVGRKATLPRTHNAHSYTGHS